MKNKIDLFSEKMPSSLSSRILMQADAPLTEIRRVQKKKLLSWILGAGLTTAAASFAVISVRQNQLQNELQMDVAQSVELFEDLQNEEDLEMMADFDLIENLDLIDQIDESGNDES